MSSTILADHHQWQKYGCATASVPKRLLEIKKLKKLINGNRMEDAAASKLFDKCCDVAEGQANYIENSGFEETPLQERIREDTLSDPTASLGKCMISSPFQGNFLKMLAEMNQAKDILEIGMFTGYGAVSLAETSCCENLVTLDVDPYCKSFFEERLVGTHIQEKIRIIIGKADESLVQLKKENMQFDLIFIDANKEGYLNYYKFIIDNNLLRSTGTIACDNVLWSGTTFDQSTVNGKLLHEFCEYVKKDERVYQMILPVRDGIFLIKPKNLDTHENRNGTPENIHN